MRRPVNGRAAAPPPEPREAPWEALEEHQRRMADVRMTDLFAGDPSRFERYSFKVADLLVDFSKHRITDETLERLLDLARAAGVAETRDAMFAGEPINVTEDRAVLHVALRNRSQRAMSIGDED